MINNRVLLDIHRILSDLETRAAPPPLFYTFKSAFTLFISLSMLQPFGAFEVHLLSSIETTSHDMRFPWSATTPPPPPPQLIDSTVAAIAATVVSYERHFVAPPPLYRVPPPMDLGRFEISKRPSNRGGVDLGLFEKSNRPS